MELNEAQARAAHARGRVIVTAGAGTGKTQTMTARYLALVSDEGLSPLEIVAVTFTNQAADELRSRVIAQLALLGNATARLEVASAPILTLHALAERIAREFPLEAAVPPDFAVADEREAARLRAAELPYLVAQLPPALAEAVDYDDLVAWATQALDDLDRFERAAAVPIAQVRDHLEAEHAAELEDPWWRSTLEELRVRPGPRGDKLEAQRCRAIDALARLAQDPADAFEVLTSLRTNCGSGKQWGEGALAEMKGLLTEVRERAKHLPSWRRYGFTETDEASARTLALVAEAVRTLADGLAAVRHAQGLLDFQDLEFAARRALAHPHVRAELHARVRAILVDEAQDLSPIEHELLDALAGPTAHVTFVGDAKQSLYGFRGAAPELFGTLRDTRSMHVVLEENFRSTPSLIACTNSVFGQLIDHHEPLRARRGELRGGSRIELLVGDETLGDTASAQRAALAERVAARLAAMLADGLEVHDPATEVLRPVEPRDIAVVSVSWSMLEVVSDALAAARIPARVARGGDLLASQQAADAVAMLAFCTNPHDDAALVALLRSPMIDLGDDELARVCDSFPEGEGHRRSWFDRLRAIGHPVLARLLELPLARDDLPPDAVLLEAADALGYASLLEQLPNAERRLTDWHGMLELTSELAAEGMDAARVVELLRRDLVDPRGSGERPPIEAGQAVSLLTIHAAKGLEWPVVVVVDLERVAPHPPRLLIDPQWGIAAKPEDGSSPHWDLLASKAKEREKAEQTRRWYVALTRARDHLMVALTKETGDVGPLIAALMPHSEQLPVRESARRRDAGSTPGDGIPVEPLPTRVVHSFALSALARCRFEAWLCLADRDGPAQAAPRVTAASCGLVPNCGLEGTHPVRGEHVLGTTTVRFGPILADEERVIDLADPAPDPVGLALARAARSAEKAWQLAPDGTTLIPATPLEPTAIAALAAELPASLPPLATTPRGACQTCWIADRCPARALPDDA
jgi:ATP-dependent helicase/nuclease subunit A